LIIDMVSDPISGIDIDVARELPVTQKSVTDIPVCTLR